MKSAFIGTLIATATALGAVGAFADTKGSTDPVVTGTVAKTKEEKKPAKAVELYQYKSVIKDDGTISVVLDEDGKVAGEPAPDVMTIFAPNVKTTERLLHSQDWYMTIDPNGRIHGIYTVPRNTSLPSTTLRGLGEGYGILKVNPRSSFFKVFPTKHQLASQIATFSEAARSSVCAQKQRPETLSANMDVKPGWSASGRIQFSATWNVADLCKKPAT